MIEIPHLGYDSFLILGWLLGSYEACSAPDRWTPGTGAIPRKCGHK
jgi:hypothetical protein